MLDYRWYLPEMNSEKKVRRNSRQETTMENYLITMKIFKLFSRYSKKIRTNRLILDYR
jgi:hypothetical protein